MQVKIKLMGGLKQHAPEGNVLDIQDGATVLDALDALSIAESKLQVVMVNGKPQPDRQTALNAGDELMLLPLVGGG